ncbi:MAG TPA: M23 family metallopeptidase, partial [Myxococcaceae bacterium]|nr:M23 family metallopeptidase [Myxococcaceae bacterium]
TGRYVLLLLLAGGAASGMWWWKHRATRGAQTMATAPLAAAQTPAVAAPASPAPAPSVPTPAEILKKNGVRFISVTIDGPLERSLVAATGRELGQVLAQVVTRTLVWWISVPAELRKGDKLEVLFEERSSEEPIVHAVRLTSARAAKSFRAYRFKPAGATFARFYQPEGSEVELRLKDAPLDDYEQVTSHVKDGRRHKGVDFKTPLGSKVKATFDGAISRRNWHFRANGNCLEITEAGGAHRKALFLHLSELPKAAQVGTRVTKGEVIAASGNSGHSFAPHLHYQLMNGERVMDPFTTEPTYRRSIRAEDKAALDAEITRLDGLMTVALAGN